MNEPTSNEEDSTVTLDVESSDAEKGHVVVADREAGHRFEFRVVTVRGEQTLSAMVPQWAGGAEPSNPDRFTIEAQQVATREAVDLGLIEADDADVG